MDGISEGQLVMRKERERKKKTNKEEKHTKKQGLNLSV